MNCTEKDNLDKNLNLSNFENYLDNENLSFNTIIIIPGSGCEGCISEAEKYVIDHSTNTRDVLFLFTSIKSKKLLNIRLGDTIKRLSNVSFDTENKIHYRSIYPMLLEKGSGDKYQSRELKFDMIKFPLKR